MKKTSNPKLKLVIIVASLVILSLASVGVVMLALNFIKSPSSEKPVVQEQEEASESDVLMSFDTYQEITGTKLSLLNDFGATKINKDEEYITQGEGSWLVKPQGDYGKQTKYPTARMYCGETTFKTNNFNSYDKLTMDVYNASDEVVEIQWNFRSLTKYESYSDTLVAKYTLEPNAWTTCEYELSSEQYSLLYNLNSIDYMTITFLSIKEGEDDTVPELYLDNMRGHLMEGERQEYTATLDLEKGVSFENMTDHCFFWNNDGWVENRLLFSRLSYKEANLTPYRDTFGEYLLKGDATGSRFPTVQMEFGQTYKAGQVLSFMLYVEADEELTKGQSYKVEAGSSAVLTGPYSFNKWELVAIELSKDLDGISFFCNFDPNVMGFNIESESVMMYMDNFMMTDEFVDYRIPAGFSFGKGITFENEGEEYIFKGNAAFPNTLKLERAAYRDGNVKIPNRSYGEYALLGTTKAEAFPKFSTEFDKTYGDEYVLKFMMYVECDKAAAKKAGGTFKLETSGILDGEGNGKYIVEGIKVNEWQEILIKFDNKHDAFSFMFNFEETSTNWWADSKFGEGPINIYMDNFVVCHEDSLKPVGYSFAKGITMEDPAELYLFTGGSAFPNNLKLSRTSYAEAGIKVPNTSYGKYALSGYTKGEAFPKFSTEFDKTYEEDQVLKFMIYVDCDKKAAKKAGGTFKIEASGLLNGESNGKYIVEGVKVNQWQEVLIKFNSKHDAFNFMLNFEDTTTNWWADSKFGEEAVNVYMDNFIVCHEDDLKPVGYSFEKGITMEDPAEVYLFTGGSAFPNNLKLDQTSYKEAGITVPDDSYGKYALSGYTKAEAFPKFETEFDKTYGEDQVLKFMMYVDCDEEAAKKSGGTFKLEATGILDGEGNGKYNVEGIKVNQWQEVLIKFSSDHDAFNFMFNFEDATTNWWADSKFGEEPVNIYMDNFIVCHEDDLKPENASFEKGITMEDAAELYLFTGATTFPNNLKLDQTSYKEAGITVPDDSYGKYALSGYTKAEAFPKFEAELDKQYEIGKKLTFMMYVACNPTAAEAAGGSFQLEASGILEGTSNAKYVVDGVKVNEWQEISIDLAGTHDKFSFMFNFEDATTSWWADSKFGEDAVNIYMDNFIIKDSNPDDGSGEQPDPEIATISDGYGFERANDKDNFTANQQIELSQSTYAEIGITAPNKTYGDNVLVAAPKGKWPTFNVAFNETLDISGWDYVRANVYIACDAATTANTVAQVKTTGYLDTASQGTYSTHTTSGDKIAFNQWTEVEFAFYNKQVNSAAIQFNLDGSGVDWDKVTIYIDNVIYGSWEEAMTTRDILSGITFEYSKEIEFFSGLTGLTRAKYSEEGLTIPTGLGLGSYGLKGMTSSSSELTVNFNEEIGVTQKWSAVCFKAYVKADATVAAGQTFTISGGTNGASHSSLAFNEWIDVEIPSYGTYSSNSYSFDLGDVTGATIYVDSFVYAPPLTENNIYTFENVVQTTVDSGVGKLNVIQPAMGEGKYASVSRVAYLDTPLGLTVPNEVGLYGYQVPVDNARTYFHITTPLLKYSAVKTVKMRIYIDCDETLAEKITVMVRGWQYNNEGNYQGIGDSPSTISLNQWIDVEVPLGAANTWRKNTAIRFRTVAKGTNTDYAGSDLNYTVYVDNIDFPAFN